MKTFRGISSGSKVVVLDNGDTISVTSTVPLDVGVRVTVEQEGSIFRVVCADCKT